MASIDDIRKEIQEYDIINPVLTFPGDIELVNPSAGAYDPNQDIFAINSLEDKYKGNLYKNFLNKYFYDPIKADKLGDENNKAFYPVLINSFNSDGNGRHLNFAYYLSVASLFEDKEYCKEILTQARDEVNLDPMFLVDKNIEWYEEALKRLEDFNKRGYYSKYRDEFLNIMLKMASISVNGKPIKSVDNMSEEIKKDLSSNTYNVIRNNFNNVLIILKSIKKEMLLQPERETGEYQDQLRKDFESCFTFDKLVLCYMKIIIDNQYRIIEKCGEISNSFNEVINFFSILDSYKGIKFNPSIKVYDPKMRKLVHYNVNDLRLDYNRIMKKYGQGHKGQSISLEQAKKLGLVRNYDKLKKYHEFLSQEDERMIRANFEIIASGEKVVDARGYNGTKTRGKGKSKKDNTNENTFREFIFEQMDPALRLMGINKFAGYVGYIYRNGLVLFEKYQDYGVASNATYMMTYKNFRDLWTLTKPEIMERIKNAGSNEIKRLYHNESWQERLTTLVNSVEITDETLMAVEALAASVIKK